MHEIGLRGQQAPALLAGHTNDIAHGDLPAVLAHYSECVHEMYVHMLQNHLFALDEEHPDLVADDVANRQGVPDLGPEVGRGGEAHNARGDLIGRCGRENVIAAAVEKSPGRGIVLDTMYFLRLPSFADEANPSVDQFVTRIAVQGDLDTAAVDFRIGEFRPARAFEIEVQIAQDDVPASVERHHGHFAVEHQRRAAPLDREVVHVVEQDAERLGFGGALLLGGCVGDEIIAPAGIFGPKIVAALFQYEHLGSRPPTVVEHGSEFPGEVLVAVGADAVIGEKHRIVLRCGWLRLHCAQRARGKGCEQDISHIAHRWLLVCKVRA